MNIVIIIYSTSVLKTKIANEQMIHDFSNHLLCLESEHSKLTCIYHKLWGMERLPKSGL